MASGVCNITLIVPNQEQDRAASSGSDWPVLVPWIERLDRSVGVAEPLPFYDLPVRASLVLLMQLLVAFSGPSL